MTQDGDRVVSKTPLDPPPLIDIYLLLFPTPCPFQKMTLFYLPPIDVNKTIKIPPPLLLWPDVTSVLYSLESDLKAGTVVYEKTDSLIFFGDLI